MDVLRPRLLLHHIGAAAETDNIRHVEAPVHRMLLISCALFMSGCAHALPSPSTYRQPFPENDVLYQLQLTEIESALISQQRKNRATTLLFQAHSLNADINRYLGALQPVHAHNMGLTRRYGTVQGLVGGMAGVSAPAALAERWAVSVPVILGLFNWIGLGTLKTNVEPTVKDGEEQTRAAHRIGQQFADASRIFPLFVAATDSATAASRFDEWATKTAEANRAASQFLGIIMPPAAPPPGD